MTTLIRNWNSCYLEQIIQAVEIALFSTDDSSEPQLGGDDGFALADVIVILFSYRGLHFRFCLRKW